VNAKTMSISPARCNAPNPTTAIIDEAPLDSFGRYSPDGKKFTFKTLT